MKTILKIMALAIAMFLVFLVSWDLIAPGLDLIALGEFKAIVGSPGHLKILGFFRPANLSFPKIFAVGVISLLFSSLVALIGSIGKKRNKEVRAFIGAFMIGDLIASFFFVKYLITLSKIMTPSGAAPFVRNPDLKYFAGTAIIITMASLLILIIALGLRKALKNPLPLFLVVLGLFVASKLTLGIPLVKKTVSSVARESSAFLERIVVPVRIHSVDVLSDIVPEVKR